MFLMALATAWAACPSTASSIEASLDSAQLAFSNMDQAAFRAATEAATADVECLSQPIAPSLAARLHRVVGLKEFVAGREDAARKAFAAARSIDAQYVFPDTLVPPAHPVRALFQAALDVPRTTTTAAAPTAGHLEFDGVSTVERPTERASVAMIVDTAGAVGASRYLWPGDPLFPYPTAEAPVAVSTAKPIQVGKKRGPNVPLAIAAGVSAAAAGATWLLARSSYDEFQAEDTPRDELPGLQTQTNALQVSSVGLGALCLAAGVGAVVTGTW